MNKKLWFIVGIVILNLGTQAQTHLNKVINRYGGNWPKAITFTQTTTMYSAKGETKQTWYEAGIFPKYFRIDFDREKGNTVIFNNDKEYYFKENKLTRTGKINNPLIYLLGGMYFDSIDTVKSKLSKSGIDISKESTNVWKGRPVLVIGAKEGDTISSQLWFDVKEMYLLRFIKNDPKSKMDVRFAGQQKIGDTWHETIVDIYANGKLIQKEEYFDFKTKVKLNEAIFDPNQIGKIHWLN